MTASLDQYTAVVVDDEPLPRAHLAHLLKEAGVGRILQAGDAAECLALFEDDEDRPDWAFLDVRMPHLDGLALADALTASSPPGDGRYDAPSIVFVTGYEDYAITAFEKGAIDYLLKPVERARLGVTLQRLAASGREISAPLRLPPPALQRLPIRMDYAIRLLDVDEIIAAAAQNKRVEVITKNTSYSTYYTLSQLEHRLPTDRFFRVHDGWIVSLASIVEMHNLGSQSYQIRLREIDRLVPVSRRRLPQLQRLLGLS